MTVIAGIVKLEAARTAFEALGQQVFSGSREGAWQLFTRTVGVNAPNLQINALGAVPAVVEQVGSREFGSVRAYSNTAPVKRFGPQGLEISAIDVELDNTGLIGQMLADYVRSAPSFWDKTICEFLFSNPTSLDGGALFSATHPYGPASGTWSNLTTNALSPAEFFTGVSTMAGLRLENSEPAGFYPDTLMVGPSNQKMAFDLTSSDRVVPIAATGLEAYASAVAAAAKSNWANTKISYVVNPRMVGTYASYWYLFDTKNQQALPIVFGEAKAPATYTVVNPESEGMVDRSACRFYAEGWSALLGSIGFAAYAGIV